MEKPRHLQLLNQAEAAESSATKNCSIANVPLLSSNVRRRSARFLSFLLKEPAPVFTLHTKTSHTVPSSSIRIIQLRIGAWEPRSSWRRPFSWEDWWYVQVKPLVERVFAVLAGVSDWKSRLCIFRRGHRERRFPNLDEANNPGLPNSRIRCLAPRCIWTIKSPTRMYAAGSCHYCWDASRVSITSLLETKSR